MKQFKKLAFLKILKPISCPSPSPPIVARSPATWVQAAQHPFGAPDPPACSVTRSSPCPRSKPVRMKAQDVAAQPSPSVQLLKPTRSPALRPVSLKPMCRKTSPDPPGPAGPIRPRHVSSSLPPSPGTFQQLEKYQFSGSQTKKKHHFSPTLQNRDKPKIHIFLQ